MAGVQVAPADAAVFTAHLGELGYVYTEETANPAYRMFLGQPAAGGDPVQVTNLPLDVSNLIVSPDGSRLAFSLEVFPDCPTLACTKERLDQNESVYVKLKSGQNVKISSNAELETLAAIKGVGRDTVDRRGADIVAAVERIPASCLEASADLGAPPRTTFWRVVAPLALPGVAAGSIFTFSLTLGDYIIPQVIGDSTLYIGQIVYRQQGDRNILVEYGPIVLDIELRIRVHALMQALELELPARYAGPMEFPMKTIAQSARHLLLRVAGGAAVCWLARPRSRSLPPMHSSTSAGPSTRPAWNTTLPMPAPRANCSPPSTSCATPRLITRYSFSSTCMPSRLNWGTQAPAPASRGYCPAQTARA